MQNPLTTLDDAVEADQRVLALQDGPTVLVGHSFGGMIVTEAGVIRRFPPSSTSRRGRPMQARITRRSQAVSDAAGLRRHRLVDGDEGRLSEEAFLRDFAGDFPTAKARVLYAVQAPFQRSLLADKTTHAAWRSKPSFYAVSTEDRTINPDLERFMAKRMGAKTIEVKASHLSLISQPDAIRT